MTSSVSGRYLIMSIFYILYYLYLGGFHASDSLGLNGSHPDMLFNLYFFSVICRINIFLLLLLLFLGDHLLDCFHTAYTHPSWGVGVPFGGCDL